MSYENWKNKAQGFQTVDVRHIQGSFFEGLKKRAEALEVGEGLHIIQTFEPHPLYAVMEGLGYEHHTEQRSEAEFHVWFCRTEKKEGDSSAPFKPLALLNHSPSEWFSGHNKGPPAQPGVLYTAYSAQSSILFRSTATSKGAAVASLI